MPSRKLGEQREIRRGLDAQRRNRHQPGQRQRRGADGIHELADLIDRTAALLRLLADIDLDIDRRGAIGLAGFPGQGVEQRAAIERMDGLEQLHRVRGLVRLKLADLVEPDVGIKGADCRPFGERLLHAIFAEVALPGLDQRRDLGSRTALADRDQLDVRRIALRQRGGGGNLVEDFLRGDRRRCSCARYRYEVARRARHIQAQ